MSRTRRRRRSPQTALAALILRNLERSRLVTAGLGSLLAGVAHVAAGQAALTYWTPEQNVEIGVLQGSLLGAHIAGMYGGLVAPGAAGFASELIAFSTDIQLKFTPPALIVPGDGFVYPNRPRTGTTSPFNCVYKFARAIPGDDRPSGIAAQTGHLYYIPYAPLPAAFGDLGTPAVYHPHADVQVTVDNRYLGAGAYDGLDAGLQQQLVRVPEFPEGRHVLEWRAGTQMNTVLDVVVPGVMLPLFALSEQYLAGQLAAKASTQGAKVAAKRLADRIIDAIEFASDLGLIGVDVSNVLEAEQWYKDTTATTAINSASQSFTVYDTHTPYFRNAVSGATRILEQTIELEATDFGGVSFGRVEDALRSRFEPIDDCGKTFETTSTATASTLLKIGTPNVVTWTAREIDGGPYPVGIALASNQTLEGDNVATTLIQRISVVDTQAPILVPPAGFARESATPVDTTTGGFPLGRPLVVDLADPAPVVGNDAPSTLGVDRRYAIHWQATDSSGNTTAPPAGKPDALTQIVTIKTPGTNTAPSAQPKTATTLTSRPVEIVLTGTDADVLDGRPDPLAFEIARYPGHGQFEAPLLPYFIEDFRLSPLGERADERTTTRTSPLKGLAATFAATSPANHGTFLTSQICNAAPGTPNQVEFGNTIPVDFVYQPTFVYVDDAGHYYVRDKFWVCGEPDNGTEDPRATLSPIPRLSKWTNDGVLVAMRPLYPTASPDHVDPWPAQGFPDNGFSVDQNGRLWIKILHVPTFGGQIEPVYSFDANLGDQQFHGSFALSEQEYTQGARFITLAGDPRFDLLYELRRNTRCGVAPQPACPAGYTRHSLNVRRATPTAGAFVGDIVGTIPVASLTDTDGSGNTDLRGIDLKVDPDGNVYLLDGLANRVHKFSPAMRTDEGTWQVGSEIGWMGRCSANLLNVNGVPYNGCDEARGVSRGYACTDTTCARPATTSGTAPGQFNLPRSIEIDPRGILYVADTGNARVQRFGPDGTFAGEAKSTGSGVNQGDAPGFILGNMGEPRALSVNSSSFYVMEPEPANGDYFVHVFKTLPFYDVTDASAKVKYVSEFDFQGADAFEYVVNDGIARSAMAAVNVTVARAFRRPERLQGQCFQDETLAVEAACSLPEDGSIFVRFSAYDPDGFVSTGGLDTLTFDVIEQPAHGALALVSTTDNAAVYRYTPDANFNGEDGLSFEVSDGNATSAERRRVALTITPQPDPVSIEFPAELKAARGFDRVFVIGYSDLDDDSASSPAAKSIAWGDGVVATAPSFANSGRRDRNGREITPQIQQNGARGILAGSHRYGAVGSYSLEVTMANAPAEGLPDTVAATTVHVIEATVVGVDLAAPSAAVDPDAVFPLAIDVTNFAPLGWAGLPAGHVRVSIELPDGLDLMTLDPRCSRSAATLSCSVGDLSVGQTASLVFAGRVSLAAARTASDYPLVVTIVDDGPSVQDENIATLTVSVADRDGDGVIDVDDAFPDDDRYTLDADGDGLADEWEAAHGLDATRVDDGAVDDDGDRFTLAEEFANGSYPGLAERETAESGATLTAQTGADDRFGQALTGGDFNRDGYADLVIGAPLASNVGAVFVAYGSANGASTSLKRLDPPPGTTQFGRSLAVGDFDGNGYPDLAIGSANAVAIHMNNGELLSTPDTVLAGATGTSNFGVFLAAGDLDGDGKADLVATAKPSGANGALRAYLSTRGSVATPPLAYTSVSPGFGDSAAIGDIDGDGRADVVVGSISGAVYAFRGAHNDWQSASTLVNSFSLTGSGSFGFSLATGADIGGDGIDDLVVGAYGGAGRIEVYDSASRYWDTALGAVSVVAPIQTIAGLDAGGSPGDGFGDQFGVRVALAHLDTDDFADVVVGANRAGTADAGQVQIFRGGVSGLSPSPQREQGATNRDMLGYFVAVPGDIDGDGFADVAAGAPEIVTAANPAPQGGYVQTYLHRFVALEPTEDSDADGVRRTIDNCPSVANTDQRDRDGDGLGDVCDPDADGDGYLNEADNCPLIASLDQTNSDTDGEGDLCDADDDNDDVVDTDDAFPLDAAYAVDTDGDGLPDEYETANGLDPANAADGVADLDGDGRSNVDEFRARSDIAADDVPPVLAIPADVTIDSTGALTAVPLTATATDAKDGPLVPVPSEVGPFVPGRHTITWRASDAAGNEASGTQHVDVIPRVDFYGAAQYVGEGGVLSVTAKLNGAAVNYPVIVPYTLAGTATEGVDYAVAGSLTITSGDAAGLDFAISADALIEGDETIVIEMGVPQNAVAGFTTEHVIHVVETNVAPRVAIKVAQAGEGRSTIVAGDGPVAMTAAIEDANAGDGHTIDWLGTDSVLVPNEGFASATFTFDPAGVPPGIYAVRLAVDDDGSPPERASATRFIRVVAVAPTLAAGADTDGDGVDDATEGLRDANRNGIDDYLEPSPNDNELLLRAGSRVVLEARAGISLALGATALASGTGAEVALADIVAHGSGGGPAADGDDMGFDYPSGIFDFEVGDLFAIGDSAEVVLPLSAPLPANARYRKYVAGEGWQDFVVDARNGVASAPGTLGACPAPGSPAYVPGLNAGDYCVALVIEDGGPNDADAAANRRVRDPGGPAIAAEPRTVTVTALSTPAQTVAAGTADVVLLRFKLGSNSADVELRRITLAATGTGNDASGVRAVKLWRDANANGVVDAGDTELGRGTYGSDDGTLQLTLTAPFTLSQGDTDFVVTYDL